MFQVLIGESNHNGNGSAAGLTQENAFQFPIDFENVISGSQVTYQQSGYLYAYFDSSNLNIENLAAWNASGLKELSLSLEGIALSSATLENFADVYVELADSSIDNLIIVDAKRGTIDADEQHSHISNTIVIPYSNGSSWSNVFEITTDDAENHVYMTSSLYVAGTLYESSDAQSTKWTEFYIELGGGSDLFYYDLAAAADSSVIRYVDGGEDGDEYEYDVFRCAGDPNDVEFANFEMVELTDDQTLYVTEQVLANNAADGNVLTIRGDAVVTMDVDSITINLSASSSAYSSLDNTYRDDYTYDDDAFSQTAGSYKEAMQLVLTHDGNDYTINVDMQEFEVSTDIVQYTGTTGEYLTMYLDSMGASGVTFLYTSVNDSNSIYAPDGNEYGSSGSYSFDQIIFESGQSTSSAYFCYFEYIEADAISMSGLDLWLNSATDEGLIVNGELDVTNTIYDVTVSDLTDSQLAFVSQSDYDDLDSVKAITFTMEGDDYEYFNEVLGIDYEYVYTLFIDVNDFENGAYA